VVYLEGIFTPAERIGGGASWDEVFTGFCDGAIEARERTGVEVRLTPDIPRNLGPEVAIETARYAIRYRERGIVGLGLGGPEDSYPGALFERAFQMARDGGLGSVAARGPLASAPTYLPACSRGPVRAGRGPHLTEDRKSARRAGVRQTGESEPLLYRRHR
jgi:aminodeoxyfutalosine deaminase